MRAQPRPVFYKPHCRAADTIKACGRCSLSGENPIPDTPTNPLPGVRAIAGLFALCGIYLAIVGAITLIRPAAIALSAGAPLLFGLEKLGPYIFLLTGLVGISIAWGLIELNTLVRQAAVLIAITGIVMLAPSVFHANVFHPKGLIYGGPGIVVRALVAWYLSGADVAESFH